MALQIRFNFQFTAHTSHNHAYLTLLMSKILPNEHYFKTNLRKCLSVFYSKTK